MTTLSDARFDSLRSQGFTGAVSDMVLQWLKFNGATSNQYSDAWKEVLDIIQPPDPGQRNDQWFDWLFINGYGAPHKQINDMQIDFWEAGGLLIPKPISFPSYNTDFDLGFPQ
jgi:hypothetical protein